MADGSLCQRCRVRPAVAAVRRVQDGMPPIVERLCEVCLREGRFSRGAGIRGGPFDDFFARLFGAAPDGGMPVDLPQPVQQVDITRFFSDATRQALQAAAQRAVDEGSADLDSDHLLWGVLEDAGVGRILRRLDVDAGAIRTVLDKARGGDSRDGEGREQAPAIAPDTKRILLAAFDQARRLGATYIGPEHLLLALAADGATAGGRALQRAGVAADAVRGALLRGPAPEEAQREASTTPALDEHGRDLTDLAREGKLDPVIGRQDEVEQTIEVLSRRTKNNPVLIGDPGVGKTAIVEGIAQHIVNGDVPDTLSGRRLVTLDVASLLAGTRYRGEFEERLKTLIDEIRRHADELLVFIDELHTIVGAGAAEGAMDAGNMLKPALARGELHVIGATTLDEYRRHVEKDAALERRFQPILVDELGVAETVQVLVGLKDRYEAFHRVRITEEAVTAAAEMADRYITDRFLPDKAIDLVDQASARVRLRSGRRDARALEERLRELTREKDQAVAAEEFERAAALKAELEEHRQRIEEAGDGRPECLEVTAESIAEIVARITGIPVSQLTEAERDRLLRLEEHLHARVVDQDEAVAVVAESIRRSRAGLADPSRPVGSFLFLGPTGVGKTELARALADALFGDDDLLVRFDMSEFQERHTVSRLVGAPPGYVGYEEAGQLTEQVRRRPYSVLLLDEVEKAHPDVFNLLLQLLDDGRLTDAHGRTVDFKNTVVIMTSNLGADRVRPRPRIGFGSTSAAPFADVRDELLAVLRDHFRPEFLNRIDDIVVFRPLEQPQLLRITRLLLDELTARLAARGIGLDVDDDAVALLADRGYQPEFGARPLRRTIQRLVENELSRLVLEDRVGAGQRVCVRVVDGELRLDVTGSPEGDGDAPVAVAGEGNWEAPATSARRSGPGPSAPRPDE